MRKLAAHHIAFFKTFGYLHIPGYYAEEISWIIDEFESAWAKRSDIRHDGSQRTIFPATFVSATPRLATLIEDPKTVEVCSSLLGAGCGFWVEMATSILERRIGTQMHSEYGPKKPRLVTSRSPSTWIH